MNIERYLNKKEFIIKEIDEFPNIIAVRRSTGKRICLIDKDLNREGELKLMKIWAKLEIHPFMVKDNQIFDMIFNEKVKFI